MAEAEPVRQHVRSLKAAGMSYTSIARVAGVSYVVVSRLLYGEPSRGVLPSRRLRKEHAQALLAVRPHHQADGALVLAVGTVRRLRALACVGLPAHIIGDHARMHPDHIRLLTGGRSGATVTVDTARRVSRAYSRLWDADPTSAGVAPARAAQVRTKALKRGWLPPAAWDDDLIDLSEEDLAAELRRQAEQMTMAELSRARRAHRDHGDNSPLMVEAVREYRRRQRQRSDLGEAS
jgi:hypothetical protein